MSTPLASSAQTGRERAAVSAPSERLLLMLYDGACRFLAQGATAMRAGDARAAHIKLGRAEAIISHLANTLDMEQGEIPRNLLSIFLFCRRHLNRARVERNPRKIEDVIRVLSQLRDAWQEISPG